MSCLAAKGCRRREGGLRGLFSLFVALGNGEGRTVGDCQRNVGLWMRRPMRVLRPALRYVSLLSSIRPSFLLHFALRSHGCARQPSSARRSRSGAST